MQNAARLRSVTQVSGSLLVDIPTGWEPQRNLVVRALRVAFSDFSAAPWQGFEKSERGPNNSSLFQPLAAVVVVAVRILPIAQKESPAHESVSGILGAPRALISELFSAFTASPKATVSVPSL